MRGLEKGWFKIEGHVHVQDDLGNVLLDDHNAVHPQNMATLLGRGLANVADYQVSELRLGNGGASVGSGGAVTYLPPVTTGLAAGLYASTYGEIVDESNASVEVPNTVVSSAGSGVQTVVTVNMEIDAAQPASQSSTDQAPSTENDFAFDELGLFSPDNLMISHIIFSPILKSANRTLTITYTLTITVS